MNGGIVMAADTKGASGEEAAVLNISLRAFLVQDVKKKSVLCLAGDDDHILEVLGSCTDERNTTDVNFFNNIRVRPCERLTLKQS